MSHCDDMSVGVSGLGLKGCPRSLQFLVAGFAAVAAPEFLRIAAGTACSIAASLVVDRVSGSIYDEGRSCGLCHDGV